MRINKYVAQASGLSRRAADKAISDGRVQVNGQVPSPGMDISDTSVVSLDGTSLSMRTEHTTIALNKPTGYVVSRNGQGSATVYDLLPAQLQQLKPVGRLDKDSSGILLMTTNGDLANQLTHPSQQKRKTYEVTLDKPLLPLHRQLIAERGITLADGESKLGLERLIDGDDTAWLVTMHEGRNRQIRRTFSSLGYDITRLHRTQFGPYALANLTSGSYQEI